MTAELQIFEGKRLILMKSRVIHWVSQETAARIEAGLQEQVSHGFYKIAELDLTINSSEIDGVYWPSQYIDICNIQQGLWKCAFGEWHEKGKGYQNQGRKVCQCEREKREEADRIRRKREEAQEEKHNTPEAKAAAHETMTKTYENAALTGSPMFRRMYAIGNTGRRAIRQSTVDEYEAKHGKVSPEIISNLEIVDDVAERENEQTRNAF